LKHTGEFPIIGVNTFLSKEGSPTITPKEVIRASKEEKKRQIHRLQQLQNAKSSSASVMLSELKKAAIHNENIFDALMETSKHCSLGQITHALYEVGGQYRRNM
jgi:methylmalonyl-CoA mutase